VGADGVHAGEMLEDEVHISHVHRSVGRTPVCIAFAAALLLHGDPPQMSWPEQPSQCASEKLDAGAIHHPLHIHDLRLPVLIRPESASPRRARHGRPWLRLTPRMGASPSEQVSGLLGVQDTERDAAGRTPLPAAGILHRCAC
jgi:hypothetical protein